MFNLSLIVVSLLAGALLQKVKALPKDTYLSINIIILYLCLPSLILISIPKLSWNPELINLCFVGWIIFAVAYVFFTLVGKKLNWNQNVIGCLILTSGLGNTAFVGLPVIEAAYGTEALKYAVVLDQAGTFLVCSTLGIVVANIFSQGRMPKRELLKKVIVFPPFLAFISALVLLFLQCPPEGMILQLLERMASLLAPLALISVGLQLKPKDLRTDWRLLSWGLGVKLILAPLVIYIVFAFLGPSAEIFKVSVLEAAMAPMITASILASSYGLHPRLAGLMVGVGVPMSFLTLSVWYFLLELI